jgi:hypothetical protein
VLDQAAYLHGYIVELLSGKAVVPLAATPPDSPPQPVRVLYREFVG